MRARLAWMGALACLLAASPGRAGDVAGSIRLGVEGAKLADVGPVVAFLTPEGGERPSANAGPPPVIRQSGAQFVPSFLVVPVGRSVRMANDDTIFHNVFSLSRPNDFDLGVYPAGQNRDVRFEHAGLVKVYCSIHASMNGAILVVPSPWFAVASLDGDYRIRDVPPGRYQLSIWNERLPVVERAVTMGDGTLDIDASVGGDPP